MQFATAFAALLFSCQSFVRGDDLTAATANLQSIAILINASVVAIENSTLLPVPSSAQLCFAQVLPQYDCSASDVDCLCPNATLSTNVTSHGNLTTSFAACLSANCTIPDQLLTEKYYKDSCSVPIRDESGITRKVTWAFFGLAVVFVLARFIARPQKLRGSGYGTDDWTILVCVALLVVLDVLVQTMTDYGLGTDNFNVSAHDITEFLMQWYIFELIYVMIIMLAKVSILQLYLRIWTEEAVSINFRRTCWIFIWIHIATMLAFVISLIFQCTPVSYAWMDWDGLHKGNCINREGQFYALGAINIAFDVFVFILPLHNFLKLNISWRRKLGVCLIFMLGLLVTVCSIVRLQYLVKVGLSSNPTWDYNSTVLWSAIECNFSLICTCTPAMAGLVQRIYAMATGKPTDLSTSSSSTSKAPMNRPEVLDPENPVDKDEMLQMQDPHDSFNVSSRHESDPNAAIEKTSHSSGTGNVELKHSPPNEETATRVSYRDAEGRLHEVKVIDRPTSDIRPPVGEGEGEGDGETERALNNLRFSGQLRWKPDGMGQQGKGLGRQQRNNGRI